jgi:hypothetical protein
MKTGKLLLLITGLLFFAPFLYAQGAKKEYTHLLTPVKNYVVCKAKKSLIIDGKAEERDWKQTQWINNFEDIEGSKNANPLYRTRVKMLYDATSLYILAELEEPHIWATYDRQDMIIYHENDFEVFIDPNGDTHNYFEYELNARNTLLDLKMPLPYRNGGKANISWNSKGFESAVSLEGTLNDPSDTDKKWTMEMKIPFADLELEETPKDGRIWKVNFSRVEWRIQAIDGKYEKIKNPATGRAYPEYNWVWSPPGLINMHYPERWAMIQFSDKEAGDKTVQFKAPVEQKVTDFLWLIYYKQQDFKRKSGRYANSLKELELPPYPGAVEIDLTASEKQFRVKALLKDGSLLSVDETGLFLTKNKTNE